MIKTVIKEIIKTIAICGTLLLAASAALAQEKQTEGAAKPMPMQHEHHGFMQEGMHHAVAKGVKLDPNFDMATHTITLRVGPMNLPAHTSHMKMPQPPDLIWTVPLDGWLLAYHPKLVDAGGNSVPGTVLHHVAFWNENRADFLCPNKEEHIFGAGSELTDWAEIPGYGYRVQKGEKIRIETMMYNPTATSYDKAYLEVAIPFQETSSTPDRKVPLRSDGWTLLTTKRGRPRGPGTCRSCTRTPRGRRRIATGPCRRRPRAGRTPRRCRCRAARRGAG